jgi:mannose-1-phosphate guanylyltransferase
MSAAGDGLTGPKFVPVILAGGSGTRFWPRSRRARAKQVLALQGDSSMIQQTVDRLAPLAADENCWVVTNHWLRDVIIDQLPGVLPEHVLAEPVARNTAPACALAAFLLEKTEPDTVIGIFPSDQIVGNNDRFIEVLAAGIKVAVAGENIVVLGIPPTRPETGYGYIEQGAELDPVDGIAVRRVKRFREKPDKHTAERFLAAGNFAWNGGIFLWTARTLANAIREHVPDMAPLLERIAAAHGTPEFEQVFADVYPECENISVDYAVLERRSIKGEAKSEIFCIPADFAWNDLGSWASLHEQLGEDERSNVVDGEKSELVAIQSYGNYVHAPGKMVALLGVQGLVVVETADAILITTLERSQDVSKIVHTLHREMGKEELI